ncbi:hypothetical protein MNBD_GAMMA12-1753 [hydrothermal vent metagenome]|uniref:Uncharacterized protein n=1 Tax=hydrothermal vent metagenome TaxID=652676 RepID=A0A3B0XVL4_9ZZZZ
MNKLIAVIHNSNKYLITIVVLAIISPILMWSSTVTAHKTGNEIRHFKSCKVLSSKKKYRKCMKCLKGKGTGDKHFHADRLFQRCMLNGKVPFFRSGPSS